MVKLDDKLKGYLDTVLAKPLPKKNAKMSDEELDAALERTEPVESGEENSPQEELCLDDLRCEFAPKYLKDHLAVFADADQIIRMRKMFKEKPELAYAERSESCEGGCDSCEADTGCTGKKSEE